ncbi:MAG: DNA-directed DNA polymerase II small subunit [Thermoplasmatota archaeon]
MRKRVLAMFAERGALLQPAALEFILSQPDPMAFSCRALEACRARSLVVTLEDLSGLVSAARAPGGEATPPRGAPDAPAPVPENHLRARPPSRLSPGLNGGAPGACRVAESGAGSASGGENVAGAPPAPPGGREVVVLKDVTGNTTCRGQLQDFVSYFSDRMGRLRRMLRGRRELAGAVSVSALRARRHEGEVRVVGMVLDIRRTAGGRVLADIEDETGRIPVLMPEEDDRHRFNLMRDEVVGVVGVMGPDRDIVYARGLVRPELPLGREPRRARDPVCAAFVSDIHVGSRTFLGREWGRFVDWLNGRLETHRDLVERVEYIVVCGDAVDGIGIYPGHEEDLVVRDVYKQYQELAEMLKTLPDRVRVVMLPGNHDAVRPAEPQPTFPREITKLFDSRTTFVGNPCLFQLEGVEVLAYHGLSIADFISSIPNLSFSNPLDAMKEMLRRRHLAPVFGDKTPIAPESRDWMVIDTVPDIFVTGHVHSAGVETFRGVMLINASAWQSQTEYQRMMNFQPVPARVTVVDLQTLAPRTISFLGQE